MAISDEYSLHIRCVRSDDVDEIKALLKTTWHVAYDEMLGAAKVEELTDRWHSRENLEKRIGQDDSVFLVAIDDGVIIAVAFAKLHRKVITLHQLYVLPDRQSSGTGSTLLRAIQQRFPQAKRIRLEVATENQNAIDFYLARGFKVVGRTDNCVEHNSGIPCYFMELKGALFNSGSQRCG